MPMTPADTFRRAYLDARAIVPCTRRAFADLVLATSLFTPRLRAAAVAWVREHPEPEATAQRRLAGGWHGWTRADDDGPRLRVVRDEPADWLLGYLGLDGDER